MNEIEKSKKQTLDGVDSENFILFNDWRNRLNPPTYYKQSSGSVTTF